MNWDCPIAYARYLASYINDVSRIHSLVLWDFSKSPSREEIAAMRSEIIAKRERDAAKYDRAIARFEESANSQNRRRIESRASAKYRGMKGSAAA